ncbi:MAG TPA: Gfo/Idh/MocA family oxidoreductase [Spirochaetia bacterium]|nr:Gfo/Idh/MocA family oxidoreductase [Spirochaetia bacterium]
MIRIGVVNIDTSHPKAFAEILHSGSRARCSAIFNDGFRGADEVDAFMSRFGIHVQCASVKELAAETDVGFIQGCNWDLHLDHAMPFIEAGKPVFIDKPVVGNVRDCDRLEALGAAGGVILGSSALRYSPEITSFLGRPESERGEVVHAYGTCGFDHFNYAVHIVESLCALLQSEPVANRFLARTVRGESSCETYSIDFSNGTAATYTSFEGQWMPYELVVMTTKGTYSFGISSEGVYLPLLDRICHYVETGENRCASAAELADSIRILLAGRLSRERGGQLDETSRRSHYLRP